MTKKWVHLILLSNYISTTVKLYNNPKFVISDVPSKKQKGQMLRSKTNEDVHERNVLFSFLFAVIENKPARFRFCRRCGNSRAVPQSHPPIKGKRKKNNSSTVLYDSLIIVVPGQLPRTRLFYRVPAISHHYMYQEILCTKTQTYINKSLLEYEHYSPRTCPTLRCSTTILR